MTEAERVSWRESREDGEWSKTLYSGLRLTLRDKVVLVTKLSHGYRVLWIEHPTHYRFESEMEKVEVPKEFMLDAWQFLDVDLEFQRKMKEYNLF